MYRTVLAFSKQFVRHRATAYTKSPHKTVFTLYFHSLLIQSLHFASVQSVKLWGIFPCPHQQVIRRRKNKGRSYTKISFNAVMEFKRSIQHVKTSALCSYMSAVCLENGDVQILNVLSKCESKSQKT